MTWKVRLLLVVIGLILLGCWIEDARLREARRNDPGPSGPTPPHWIANRPPTPPIPAHLSGPRGARVPPPRG